MKKRKLRKGRIGIALILLFLITGSIIFSNYSKTDYYKLHKLGYNKQEIKIIQSLNKKDIETIKNINYDKNIPVLIQAKEFKKESFKEYYDYQKGHKTTGEETVFIINNQLDKNENYDETKIKSYMNFSLKANVPASTAVELVNSEITDPKIITSLQKEKYYKESNLKRYLLYYSKFSDEDLNIIIRNVNANLDYDYYTNIQKTDLEKGNLIIVNKYYQLDQDYEPDDLTEIEDGYYAKVVTKNAYLKMKKDAKKENLFLALTSAYRSYSTQESIYNRYVNQNGQAWADDFSAKPGHSEHQTGLALDITSDRSDFNSFENTKEYEWLRKNAYKYGFILRYQEDTEDITGYHFESWHYRYVGLEVAKQIYDENITYEEYYEYYINK